MTMESDGKVAWVLETLFQVGGHYSFSQKPCHAPDSTSETSTSRHARHCFCLLLLDLSWVREEERCSATACLWQDPKLSVQRRKNMDRGIYHMPQTPHAPSSKKKKKKETNHLVTSNQHLKPLTIKGQDLNTLNTQLELYNSSVTLFPTTRCS